MNNSQIAPWGAIVPWVERAGEPSKGVLYLVGSRFYIAEYRNGALVLTLNGRERSFPDRTSLTRWVKTHLV